MNNIQTAEEKVSASQKRYNKMKAVRELLHPLTYECLVHWTTVSNPDKTSNQINSIVSKLLVPTEKSAVFIAQVFTMDRQMREYVARIDEYNNDVRVAFSSGIKPIQQKVSLLTEILEEQKSKLAQ